MSVPTHEGGGGGGGGGGGRGEVERGREEERTRALNVLLEVLRDPGRVLK